MCNLNLPLVAWIDGELPASEAVAVAHHVQGCTDCRARASGYENVTRDFAGYYTAATRAACAIKPPRRVPSWVPFAAAAAAVAVVGVLLLLPRAKTPAPAAPQVANVTTPVQTVTTQRSIEPAQRVRPVAKRAASPRRQPMRRDWAIAQPTIQIAIPADSVFPPGAVPEGVAYIANVSFAADGSVQRFRLRP